MLVKIAYKPLINIEETTDFETQLTPQQVFDEHTELHGECVLMQLNGGDYLCRETEWDKPLKATDTVLIQVQPLRDPSSILVFVLNMMISSFATWAVSGIANATVAAIVKSVIIMAGSMLVNQLLPTPSKPTPQKIPDPSPTYSLSGNFNRARLGQAVPVRYGEGWATPDLAMGSYNEYDGGDQVFHALFVFGTGGYNFLHAKMQDTDITNFPHAEVEYVKPGNKVTLVPAQVFTATGVVSGNLTDQYTASSVSCPVKAQVNQIGVDYVFGRGLGKFDNKGKIKEHTVTLEWHYRLIDDAGNAIGAWTALTIKSITAKTNSTVRGSIKVSVPLGRHEIQARRTTPEITDDNKVMDEAQWGGMRGYNNAHPDYGDVTMIALKVRVTEGNVQLVDNNTLQQFQVWYQAQIPVYDGNAWVKQFSRNPVWALHDAYTNKKLGRKDPDTVPLDEWKAIADKLDTQQHHFDYSFDQQIQLGEALQIIGLCGRLKVYQHGGLLRLWRDEKRELAKQVFNPDNTWDFNQSFACQQIDAPTGITINYRNHATGKPAELTYAPNDNKENLQTIDFPGCEDNAHAFDEAAYRWQANQRNVSGSFSTGLEAASLTFGDLIAVPSDETEITTWGHIVYAVGNTLYLSNPHGLTGAAVMAIPSGGQMHYVDIAPGAGSDVVTVAGALPAITAGNSANEATIYIIGTINHPIILGHITKISPSQDDSATIEYAALEQIWQNPPPPVEEPPPSTTGKDLDCCNIKVLSEPDGDRYKLNISWREAPDAEYFVLGINEGGGNWQRIYNGASAQALYTTTAGTIQLRAAAFNQALGAFCYLDYEVGKAEDNTLPPPEGLALVGNFVCATLRLQIGLVKGASAYVWKIYSKSVGTNPPVFRREIKQTGDKLDYDWQMNREDGTGRDITVRVWSVDAAGNLSSDFSEGTFSNPQISGLSGVSVTGFTTSLFARWNYPVDCDTLGAVIHASQTSGFTPSPTTFVGESRGKQFAWGVPHGSKWYVRLAGFDAWGQDNLIFTDEIEVTAQILNIEDFAGELPIDRVVGLLKTNEDLEKALLDVAQAQADVAQAQADILVDRQSIIDAATDRGTIKQSVIALDASTDTQFATVNQNLTAATTEREALSQSVTNLNTSIGNNSSSLQTLQFALTTEEDARAAADLTLLANFNNNSAAIQAANIAIADETSARTSQFNTLNASVGNNTAAIVTANNAIADETSARTSQFNTLNASVGNNTAAIVTANNAIADETTARTNSITSLTANYDGQIAAISSTQTAQATSLGELTSRYVLKVQAGNNWGGQIIQAVEKPDGTGSVDVAFYADTFKVIANRNGQPVQMFMVNGNSVGVNGNLLVDGTVTAEKLTVNNLAAVSADLGTVTAGYLRSADARFGINLTATGTQKTLVQKDLSNNTTFRLRKNGDVYSKGKFNIQQLEASVGVFDTIHVKNNAITSSIETANNAGINPYRTSWRDAAVLSKVIKNGDNAPRAYFSIMLNHGGAANNNRIAVRLLVNNNDVWSLPAPAAGSQRENISATVLLPTGPVTVKLQVRKSLDDGQGVVLASHRFLSIQESLR